MAAVGIHPDNPLKGYTYTLTYPTSLRVVSRAAKLGTSSPSSSPVISNDPLPDSDGSFTVTFDDLGPPGSAESGNGVLDTIGIEDVGFVAGLNAGPRRCLAHGS